MMHLKGLQQRAKGKCAMMFSLVILFNSVSCCSIHPSHDTSLQEEMYAWLLRQQQPSGLLGNQEGDNLGGVYANALAALCYIHEGDLKRAERIFDFFDSHFTEEFAPPGGFHQMWNPREGIAYTDTDRWIGDNAWLLIALNHYLWKTGSDRYETMRRGVAEWLVSLQDADGGVLSGYTQDGPMGAKSTEGNLDCYAALWEYPPVRERIKSWLTNDMWVEADQRFRMGSTVTVSALDGSSWSVAALGDAFSPSLRYAEKDFLRSDTCVATGNTIIGFSDFIDKERVWFEGTGQMVVAYQVAGKPNEANRFLTSMKKGIIRSGGFPGTVGLPCFSSQPDWEGSTERVFVPSQAWFLFGCWGFNPLAVPDCGEGEG